VQGRLLGLQLVRADAAHPLGWSIVHEDEHAIVLAAEGPGGAARIVGTTPPGRLVVSTRARFDRFGSRTAWRVAAPVHRRIARYLLDKAVEGPPA
jgi:hypothetical protein